MGWIRPTNYNDVDGQWTNEPSSYDGNTGTYASSTVNEYYHWLELLLPQAIYCDKVRIYCAEWSGYSEGNSNVQIEVYDGTNWLLVFAGTVSKNQWIEKQITDGPKLISKARVYNRFIAPGYTYMKLKEFEFNRVGANIAAIAKDSNNLLGI